MQNLIEVIKSKNYVIPSVLLENYRQMKLTEFELVIIIYYLNQENLIYDPKKLANFLSISHKDIIETVADLQNKNIIKIDVKNENGIHCEYISLEKLYTRLGLLYTQEKKELPTTIFSQFEKEFGRTLSPIEFEIINTWKDYKVSEELIIAALKEAIYNGVRSLRYIDAILNEWNKKGIKTVSDINNKNKKVVVDKKLFDYDWLNED